MTASGQLLHIGGLVMVFGGPYSNLEATRAVLDQAAQLQIPAEQIICTGDVVAYGGDPAQTVELVRAAGCRVIMGNCEESLAADATDCGCGFPPGSACERLSAAWFMHARSELRSDARAWMASLPRRIDIEIGGYRLAVVHGGRRRINQFIFASTTARIKNEELDEEGLDGVIAGHCGLPFSRAIGHRLWHNPGAVGLPANDGTPRVWYSILFPEPGGLAIEHRALEYDHRSAAEKMRRAGLPDDYVAALATGLWPSCDVLPLKEIRERGVPLQQSRVLWRPTGRPARKRSIVCRQLWPTMNAISPPRSLSASSKIRKLP
jgi:predicted phosphodiesterase